MKIFLLFIQMILIVHGMPAAHESEDLSQDYVNHGNSSDNYLEQDQETHTQDIESQAQQQNNQQQQQDNQEQLSDNEDYQSEIQVQQSGNQTEELENQDESISQAPGSENETQTQVLENIAEPIETQEPEFYDYSYLINPENVGQQQDIETQDSINQAQGSENELQDSAAADYGNSVQISQSPTPHPQNTPEPDNEDYQSENQVQQPENETEELENQEESISQTPGSENETQTQELENIAEPTETQEQEFYDYSYLINPENVGQQQDIETQDSINQIQGSINELQDSAAADEVNSIQDLSSSSTVNFNITSGGHFDGESVNSRTYYSDTVHDCQRRCQRKRLCSQFNFRKEDGEDDGECTLLRRKTTFKLLTNCHNCKTGPKFSRQSHIGPIVVEKIIAQVSPGSFDGTDASINFRFKSGDSKCVTRTLDDSWNNNWATGTQETHEIRCRIENPGEFIQLEARFEMDTLFVGYDRLCLGDFRVTLDDLTEYSYEQELCGEGPNSPWVTLQRVL